MQKGVVIRKMEVSSPTEFVLREYLFSGDASETAKSVKGTLKILIISH